MEVDFNDSAYKNCDEKCGIDEKDLNKKLKCRQCDKHYHYKCTNLPTYQIGIFVKKELDGENTYICEKCVDIPDEVKQLIDSWINEKEAEISLLKKQIETKDGKMKVLEDQILTLETEQPLKKRRLDDDMNEVMMEDSANKTIEIDRLKKEIDLLKDKDANGNKDIQMKALQKVVQDKTKEVQDLQRTNDNLSLKQIELTRNHTKNDDIDISHNLAKMIEEKLTAGLSTIHSNVEKLINDKFDKLVPDADMENANSANTNGQGRSYADCVTNQSGISGNDFRDIILATKNDELAEESERKRRGKNLIVHGKHEQTSDDDKEFINQLIKDLQVGAINVKQIERLGNINGNNGRPIKLVFNNEGDKEKVFHNLRNLKGKNYYQGVSIKEDYTYNERLLIKKFVEQANSKNKEEESKNTNIIWRVRGTPKNGLTLKWFIKIQKEITPATNR